MTHLILWKSLYLIPLSISSIFWSCMCYVLVMCFLLHLKINPNFLSSYFCFFEASKMLYMFCSTLFWVFSNMNYCFYSQNTKLEKWWSRWIFFVLIVIFHKLIYMYLIYLSRLRNETAGQLECISVLSNTTAVIRQFMPYCSLTMTVSKWASRDVFTYFHFHPLRILEKSFNHKNP